MTCEWVLVLYILGQDLNVQLYIHSFILFKWLRWQSGLNISYTIKSLRVTQISQRGLHVVRDG